FPTRRSSDLTYNSAKNVDQNCFYIRIFQDDIESDFYSRSISSTSYIKEICRVSAGKFNDIHGSHCKTCSVYHTGNIAIKLYEIKASFPRFYIHRIFLSCISQFSKIFMTEK